MKKKQTIYLCCALLICLPCGLRGQANAHRKWALSYSGDVLLKPILTHNPANVSTGQGGSAFMFAGEYYLPDKWSLQIAYFHTDLSYGDGSRLMEGLQLGGRRYFLRPEVFIQPYVSGAGQINWGTRREEGTFGSYLYINGQLVPHYTGVQRSVNPVVSFVPGAGLELRLFSSVDLFIEYNLHLGIGSHTNVETSFPNGNSLVIKDKGAYHSVGLGVRISFPFSFTSDDGMTLGSLIFGLIMGVLDNHNERAKQSYY
jgi:hypothetical protein